MSIRSVPKAEWLVFALTLLFLCPVDVSARAHVLVSVEKCAWLATDIVVVTKRRNLNGNVTVIESLLGSLQPGASLHIRELASFKPEKSRQIKCMDDGLSLGDCPKNDGKAAFVSGFRIVLFLRKRANPSSNGWSAITAVWIEQGVAYGLWDGDSDWSGTLASIGSEGNLREAAGKVARAKAWLGVR